MRHQIQTLRLRFWAFCQFLYDLLTQPTLSDRGISFREEFVRTCLLGRVNQLRFVGLEDDFPELKGKRLFATSHLRRVALANLDRLKKMPRRESGILLHYLEATDAHLRRCDKCLNKVVNFIIDDQKLSHGIGRMFRGCQHR